MLNGLNPTGFSSSQRFKESSQITGMDFLFIPTTVVQYHIAIY